MDEAASGNLILVHTGIKGFVKGINGKALEGASVTISDRQHPVTAAEDGDYWRLLVPGSYEISASCSGYRTQRKVVEVHSDKVSNVNFNLKTSTDDDGELYNGNMYDDPREGNKQAWAPPKRIHDEDSATNIPEDTKGDFSEESSNEDEKDRPQTKNSIGVRRPASPEEEEDSSFERKDHLAIASETKKTNKDAQHTAPIIKKEVPLKRSPTPKEHVRILKQNNRISLIGEKVVCHVRGKAGNLNGVLKWRGHLPTLPKTRENIVAGIELTTADKLGTDGTFMGKRYFEAAPKRGYFVKYKDCKKVK